MSGKSPLLPAALLASVAVAPFASASVSIARPATAAAVKTAHSPESVTEDILKADTPEAVARLRERLRADKPVAALTPLLSDKRLAVRLAALEVLEELAGNDFGYDAWTPPDSPDNAEPLARWKNWAASGKPGENKINRADDATLRGYLNDTLGDDEARRERALRMMLRQGRAALGVLERHRAATTELSDVAKARLAEARYAIVMHDSGIAAARTLARDLAFGSRDRRIEAIGALRAAGPGVLPVLAEFIDSPEPLVRETAVEAFMSLGGESTHATLAERVNRENDENVLHAILRGLGEKRSETGADIARSLLTHADEEIVCGALECLCPKGSSEKPDATTLAAIRRLSADPRWRLRAASLDAIARLKLGKESDLIVRALDDADPFVRSAAIRAAAETKTAAALEKLEKLANTDDDTQMPAVRALRAFGRPVPDALAQRIPVMDRDRVLSWLTASQGVQEERIYPPETTLFVLAKSTDKDIAGAALVTLIERHPSDPRTLTLASSALASAKPAELPGLIEKFPVPAQNSRQSHRITVSVEPVASSPEVESIFSAMLTPGQPVRQTAVVTTTTAKPATSEPAPATTAGDCAALIRPYLAHATPAVSRAALKWFAASGDETAITKLSAEWKSIDDDERLRLCERLTIPNTPAGAKLLTALLSDSLAVVRKGALGHLSGEGDLLRKTAFESFVAKDSVIHPADVLEALQWQLEYSDRGATWPNTVGMSLLKPDSPADRAILGIILAGESVAKLPDAELARWTRHEDPLVRRAAWFALVRHQPLRASRSVDAIVGDRDAAVRITATRLALPIDMPWDQRISPTRSVPLVLQTYRNTQPPISRSLPAALGKLLDDADPIVRFDSALALLSIGKPVELDRFTEILRAQPDAIAARKRIATIVNGDRGAMPIATLRTLAGFMDAKDIESSAQRRLAEGAGTRRTNAVAAVTFAELVSAGDAPVVMEGAKQPAPDAKPVVATTSPATLVVFVKAGCRECDRVESLLRTLRAGDPTLVIHRHMITDTDGILLNRHLADKRGLAGKDVGRTPAVFGRDGALIGDAITGAALEKLAVAGKSGPADDGWTKLPESEKAAVAAKVQETFAGLSLAVILGAGLLDGLNPCAFATLIFLISYLQVARRSPREILLVGGAFVSAVYLTYFAIGLGLHGLLGALAGLAWMRAVINFGFATLALGLAVFSLRDGLLARAGRLRDMNLQLPGWIKDRVRGVIREGAKARHFVLFAFFSGIVISVLELACTGQVYAPIVNQIRQGSMNAVGALAAYNAAFILPLLVVFALAYGGLRSEALIRFQSKHTATVRFATAAIFLTLAVLLFASEWRTIAG